MGTTYHIKVLSGFLGQNHKKRIAEGIQKTLDAVEKDMSTYHDDSEISLINTHHSGDPIVVSPSFAEVLKMSLDLAKKSGGIYDPTVYPLVYLWGFARKKDDGVPSAAKIRENLKHVGYFKVRLENGTLTKLDPMVSIDLSSVAKGYGVDQVGLYLDKAGLHSYMVEVGGEVLVKGKTWHIGIRSPIDSTKVLGVLSIPRGAIATSGDYLNYKVVSGKTYSHIIDPKTGYPTKHHTVSVSVIAQNTALADAYATALLAMGYPSAMELAKKENISALLITKTTTNEGENLQYHFNGDFQSFFLDNSKQKAN